MGGTDGTVQGGLADKTMYVVSNWTDQGFKLLTVGHDLAKTTTNVALTSDTSGHAANTFTKIAGAVKREIKNVPNTANTLTIGSGAAALTANNKALLYCTNVTGCKIE